MKTFDCIDDDEDWNYYYCTQNNQSYESKQECGDDCESIDNCIQHLYACVNYESEEERGY